MQQVQLRQQARGTQTTPRIIPKPYGETVLTKDGVCNPDCTTLCRVLCRHDTHAFQCKKLTDSLCCCPSVLHVRLLITGYSMTTLLHGLPQTHRSTLTWSTTGPAGRAGRQHSCPLRSRSRSVKPFQAGWMYGCQFQSCGHNTSFRQHDTQICGPGPALLPN